MDQATANLASVLNQLSDRDKTFAMSLLSQAANRPLSPKQLYWVHKLYESVKSAQLPPITINVAPLIDLINKNNRAQWPKIRVMVGTEEIIISRAGDRYSRFPGSLNVCSAGRYGEKTWFGRIHLDGKWEPSRKIESSKLDAILAQLQAMANDPAGTAAAYGKQTGHCCFCAKALNDSRSLIMGYGPICAETYQLPWGEKAA